MPQVIYGNQAGTETLRAGFSVSINVDAGTGCKLERLRGGVPVGTSQAITATTTVGPFSDDMVLRISANSGATIRTGPPSEQVVQRVDDTGQAALQGVVTGAGIGWAFRDTIGFGGDSIANGAGSSNAGSFAFPIVTQQLLGSGRTNPPRNVNVPGDNSSQLLASIRAGNAAGCTFFFTLIGTNDVGNSVPLATYRSNMQQIAAALLAIPGMRKIGFGTVPPRGSDIGTAGNKLIDQYNTWLRQWCKQYGYVLAETNAALLDAATGYMAASLDSNSGGVKIHPNDAGHLALARAIFAALDPVIAPPINLMVRGKSNGYGLIADPVGSSQTSWDTNLASPQAAVVVSLVAPTGTELEAGNWWRATVTNAPSTTYTVKGIQIDTTGFSVGDKILIVAKCKDSDGTFYRAGIRVGTSVDLGILIAGGSNVAQSSHALIYTWTGTESGSFWVRWSFGWTIGETFWVQIGMVQAFNLTKMALDGVIV